MSGPIFEPMPKIARFSRECTITEKIDGTNASIFIGEDGTFLTASRTRWINVEDDNYGFAKWCATNRDELLTLGPGHHFGEWWGLGIQRNYGQTRKRFSLFNTLRWNNEDVPECCDVVPVLYTGPVETSLILSGIGLAMATLSERGSQAAPGFMKPEGIVIFHHASRQIFKKTLLNDEKPKGSTEAA